MKTIRKFSLLAPCLILVASIARSQSSAPKTKIYRHEAFGLRVPADVTVVKRQVIDFDILSLKRNKTPLMNAYVGGHSSFPSDDAPKGKSATHFKIGVLDAKFLRWQHKKGSYCGETLVAIHQNWADVIHFYYRDLSQQDAARCESIIRSVRLNPKSNLKIDKGTFVPVN